MPAATAPVPAVVIAVVEGRRCVAGMWGRWIRVQRDSQRQKLAPSRGQVAGWIGIRCLMPGIRGRVFAGCIFVMPGMIVSRLSLMTSSLKAWRRQTLRSSHVVNLLTPSPTSLKPSLVSSNRSCTLSRTRSVSRFVPKRLICCDSFPILEVRVKSCSDSDSLKRLNSGSSWYSGSSDRRNVVGYPTD